MIERNTGFTLIELLIVVAVIGVLAGIVVLSISDSGGDASDAVKKANMRLVGTVYAQVLAHEARTAVPLPRKEHFCSGDIDGRTTETSIETIEKQIENIVKVVIAETNQSASSDFGTAVAGYLSGNVANNQIPEAGCVATNQHFAIWSTLEESEGYWCVDSFGFVGAKPYKANLGENTIPANKVRCTELLSSTAPSQGGQNPPRDRSPGGR